jgi:phosphatidylinositol alpha-mannosyltransferase
MSSRPESAAGEAPERSRRLKIALVSPYDWSYPGGVRSHIEHLAAELRARGHHVRILTPASGLAGREVEYGIYKLGAAMPVHFNGSVARIALTPSMKYDLPRILDGEAFDVVHVHEPFVSTLTLAALKLAHQRRIATVATFHASSNSRTSPAVMAYALTSPFLRSIFAQIDGAIAVSESARDHVARFFAADFCIIPNGIDLEHYASGATRLPQFDDGKRNVLFLSRMEPRKGLRYLLKAIPLVREQSAQGELPPVRFILAGDGPERQQFQKFVYRHGWDDVIFTGYVSDDEKPSYFASADVYCAPSTGNESQGIVLLEALASGVPVVASDIPGYRTVITGPEVGLMTPPRDAERLAWTLCHVLRDDDVRARLAAQGRAHAQHFSWGRVTSAVEQVYQESRRHAVGRVRRRRTQAFDGTALLSSLDSAGRMSTPSVYAISPFDENVVE